MPKLIDHSKVQDTICEQLTEGRSLHSICKDEDMPSIGTVMKWVRENTAFSQQYAHAREAQAEIMSDKMVQLALEPEKDADPQQLRMQMDAIKWAAGKMRPSKYGEANLLKRRADQDYDREMINITPTTDEGEVELLDKKELARVIWHTLFAPEEENNDEA